MPGLTPAEEAIRLNEARAALAADRGEPAPAPWPVPHPGGLLAWADTPTSGPGPLPPLETRRTRRGTHGPDHLGWPVGLLPGALIAADLTARGLAFARGAGYTLHGDRISVDQAARMVADVLDAAAFLLPDPRLAALRQIRAVLGEESMAARLRACDDGDRGEIPDGVEFLTWARALDTSGPMRAATALALADATDADRAEDTRETAAERVALRHALRATAQEIRVSAAARRGVVDLVRPHLRPATRPVDATAADAFLARFDAETTLRRSALAPAYAEAGSPGALTKTALLAAADARWGTPARLHGHVTYRPARTVRP
ncbi:hypothetical protein [Actinotalea sp. Marseille-Q4924]|uniref:hypothetical protein n=1 Tax=Actinotalea sp. Marseille-Q4924 TaxID=2866571 RepID=UPI001CE414C6|nr:hypothetical protein [Actinotalea sp. Marseille-Q4924]